MSSLEFRLLVENWDNDLGENFANFLTILSLKCSLNDSPELGADQAEDLLNFNQELLRRSVADMSLVLESNLLSCISMLFF